MARSATATPATNYAVPSAITSSNFLDNADSAFLDVTSATGQKGMIRRRHERPAVRPPASTCFA